MFISKITKKALLHIILINLMNFLEMGFLSLILIMKVCQKVGGWKMAKGYQEKSSLRIQCMMKKQGLLLALLLGARILLTVLTDGNI
jgi:hypothetical protein